MRRKPRRGRRGPRTSFRLVPMLDANSRQMTTQCLLRRAAAGDEAAVDALLRHSCDRLTRLTRRMLDDGLLEPERKAAERP